MQVFFHLRLHCSWCRLWSVSVRFPFVLILTVSRSRVLSASADRGVFAERLSLAAWRGALYTCRFKRATVSQCYLNIARGNYRATSNLLVVISSPRALFAIAKKLTTTRDVPILLFSFCISVSDFGTSIDRRSSRRTVRTGEIRYRFVH